VLIIDQSGDVTLESKIQLLGPDWGKGEFLLYDYAGAVGQYDDEKGVITFNADDQTLAVGRYPSVNAFAGFRFYFSYDAYIADNPKEEIVPVDADVTTYEGTWKVSASDPNTGDPVVVDNVTIVSGTDEDGQYYTISGLHADIPEIYGYFDEEKHTFYFGYNEGAPVVKDDVTYTPTLYPLTPEGKTNGNANLEFEPAEDGSLVLTEATAAAGFLNIYFAEDNSYVLGDGLFNLTFTPAAAQEATKPAKAAKRSHERIERKQLRGLNQRVAR
jgi:hypothetical protein